MLLSILSAFPTLTPTHLLASSGVLLPFEVAPWIAAVRRAIAGAGWTTGRLLARAAHGRGLAGAVAVECLASGCDGVWAGGQGQHRITTSFILLTEAVLLRWCGANPLGDLWLGGRLLALARGPARDACRAVE